MINFDNILYTTSNLKVIFIKWIFELFIILDNSENFINVNLANVRYMIYI